MNVLSAKVIALVSLFVATTFFGAIPYKFANGQTERRLLFVSLASCFAGGVFLGTSFLHLLPDVRESFQTVFDAEHLDSSYPISEFVVVTGFFLVLFFEQVVLLIHRPGARSQCKTRNVPPHGCHKKEACKKCDDPSDTQGQNEGYGSTPQSLSESTKSATLAPFGNTAGFARSPESAEESVPLLASNGNGQVIEAGTDAPESVSDSASVRSLLLLGALSLHSLFEGLAMGLQNDVSSVFEVFVAVLLHKCILAFSLGVRFVRSGSGLSGLLKAVFVFAVMSPVGVCIGIAITEAAGDDDDVSRHLATAILQGIATGTFIFVTFLEVLAHELMENRTRGQAMQILKVLACLIGFSVMAGVQFADNHDHGGHDHDHDHDHH